MHYVYDGNTKASEDIFRKRWYFVSYRSILPLSPTECSSAATSMIMISRSISAGSQCMGTWKADRKMVYWTPDLAEPYIGLGASWRCGSNPKHFWLRNSFRTHTISDPQCKLNINAIVFVPSHFKSPRIAFCLDSTDVNSNGLAPVLKRSFHWALTAQMLFTSLFK